MQFERLDFAKVFEGDDPMGLSNFFDADETKPALPADPEPLHLREDLHAFGQKIKGKEKNDDKLNQCGRERHYARDYSSSLLLSDCMRVSAAAARGRHAAHGWASLHCLPHCSQVAASVTQPSVQRHEERQIKAVTPSVST